MSELIRAAVLNTARGTLDRRHLALAPSAAEAVVRMRIGYAGLCRSGLHESDGTFPIEVPIRSEASGIGAFAAQCVVRRNALAMIHSSTPLRQAGV